MQILDATTKSLELLLSGTVATTQLTYVSNYVDTTSTAFTPGNTDGASNNTTAVTIAAAPAASTQRQVKEISVYNGDTQANIVTIRLNVSGTFRIICKATVDIGKTLVYVDSVGFYII